MYKQIQDLLNKCDSLSQKIKMIEKKLKKKNIHKFDKLFANYKKA